MKHIKIVGALLMASSLGLYASEESRDLDQQIASRYADNSTRDLIKVVRFLQEKKVPSLRLTSQQKDDPNGWSLEWKNGSSDKVAEVSVPEENNKEPRSNSLDVSEIAQAFWKQKFWSPAEKLLREKIKTKEVTVAGLKSELKRVQSELKTQQNSRTAISAQKKVLERELEAAQNELKTMRAQQEAQPAQRLEEQSQNNNLKKAKQHSWRRGLWQGSLATTAVIGAVITACWAWCRSR